MSSWCLIWWQKNECYFILCAAIEWDVDWGVVRFLLRHLPIWFNVQCPRQKIFSSFDLDVASSGIVVGDVYWVAVGLILTDWYLGGNYVCYLIEKFRFFTQSSWACLDWVTPAWPSLDFHSVQDKLNSSKSCLHTTHITFFRCPSITWSGYASEWMRGTKFFREILDQRLSNLRPQTSRLTNLKT